MHTHIYICIYTLYIILVEPDFILYSSVFFPFKNNIYIYTFFYTLCDFTCVHSCWHMPLMPYIPKKRKKCLVV